MFALPRPIYRWKSFWLGVLILLCLGWSWYRSIHHNEWIDVGAGANASGGIAHVHSRLGIYYNGIKSFNPGWHSERVPAEARLPSPLHADAWGAHPGSMGSHAHLLIAHWCVILGFLIPWTAFLLWRHHRLKRPAEGP